MSETLKKCRKGKTHDDALALVEYLMARGGKVAKTNEAIAIELGMLKKLGGGNLHGYRLHYRASGRGGSELTLIDPTGDLGPHANAAIESVRGWMSREAQHHTENQRQIETWERLGDHALAQGDKTGYRICARASVELERDGTVSQATMAEAAVWLNAMDAA